MKKSLRVRLPVALAAWLAAAGCAAQEPQLGHPLIGDVPQRVEDTFIPDPGDFTVETWVEGLEVPWALVFLPDGRALVTERPGRVRLIRDGRLAEKPYLELAVNDRGEGGLMGLAAHPDFPDRPFLYIMYTYWEGGRVFNRVERLIDRGDGASTDRVIVDRIPGGANHDGGRIAFGPDGLLYITTGDTFDAPIAQDLSSLGGKILRVTPDGAIPEDNPFRGSPVYSYGHRNPQGLAWHPQTGDLFASEHGPSGEFGLRGMDTIDVIVKGGNYGWPLVLGLAEVRPYRDPLIMWEAATPPGGMAFHRGDLYVATLRSEALVRIGLEGSGGRYRVTSIERLFAREGSGGRYGRLRDVVEGPDGSLYALTSNRDGRGRLREGDDRILRLVPRG